MFVKQNNTGEEVEPETSFRRKVVKLLRTEEFDDQYNAQINLNMRHIAEFERNESG